MTKDTYTIETVEESTEIFISLSIVSDEEVRDYCRSFFNCCDTDKDGFVSVHELKRFLETQEEIAIPEDVLDSIYGKFDKNKDRQLDFEEFLEMINNKTFKEAFYSVANRFFKFVVIPKGRKSRIKIQRTITMTGEYEKNLKCGPNVVGMAMISVLQLIFFYVNAAYQKGPGDLGPLIEALCYNPCKKKQIYRYITYLLLHADPMHLYGNVVVQVCVGIALEMMHSWRVVVIYVAGALGGSMAHSVLDRRTPLVGGSGGVFAFFSAHIAEVIMNWRQMTHPAVRLLLFGTIVVIDVVYDVFTNHNSLDVVSYMCHAGGATMGLLFGINILRNLHVTDEENIIWYICLVTQITLLMIFVIMDFKLPMEIDCSHTNFTIT